MQFSRYRLFGVDFDDRVVSRVVIALTVVFFFLACLELAKVFTVRLLTDTPVDDPDFRWNDVLYYWYAGRDWLGGLSPYREEYPAAATAFFSRTMNPFYYPPNNYPFSVALALVGPLSAIRAWLFAAFAMLAFGIVTATRAVTASKPTKDDDASLVNLVRSPTPAMIVAALGLTALFASNSAAMVLKLGQTATLVFFGYCILLFALPRRKMILSVIGLSLVMTKPQYALPILATLFFFSDFRRVVFFGGVASLALASPALFVDPPIKVFSDFLGVISDYGGVIENRPRYTSGLPHLLDRFSAPEMGSLFWVLVATAASVAAAYFLRSNSVSRARRGNDDLMLLHVSMLCVLIFTPLHEYDMIVAFPILLQLFVLSGEDSIFPLGLIAILPKGAAMLTIFSAEDYFERAPQVSMFYTIAVFLTAWIAWRYWRGKPALPAQ